MNFTEQVWACRPEPVKRLSDLYQSWLNSPGPTENSAASAAMTVPEFSDPPTKGQAVIPIRGILLDAVPEWARRFNFATGYDQIRTRLSAAAQDKSIRKILLLVDSPGGMVNGLAETVAAIRRVRSAGKEVSALVKGEAASAAYQLVSQAHRIEAASADSLIGSIGTFVVVVDYSQEAKDMGVRVHVVSSGEYKGMGTPGSEITERHLALWKSIVDGMSANFVQTVAEGRGVAIEKIQTLATGAFWLAEPARTLGLIDAVAGLGKVSPTKGRKTMEENELQTQLQQAREQASREAVTAEQKRFAALQSAFPEEPDFVMAQYAAGHSVEQAKAEYADILAARLKEAQTAKSDLEAKLTAAQEKQKTAVEKAAPTGAAAVSHSEAPQYANLRAAAKAIAAERKIPYPQALSLAAGEFPELHTQAKTAGCPRGG